MSAHFARVEDAEAYHTEAIRKIERKITELSEGLMEHKQALYRINLQKKRDAKEADKLIVQMEQHINRFDPCEVT